MMATRSNLKLRKAWEDIKSTTSLSSTVEWQLEGFGAITEKEKSWWRLDLCSTKRSLKTAGMPSNLTHKKDPPVKSPCVYNTQFYIWKELS